MSPIQKEYLIWIAPITSWRGERKREWKNIIIIKWKSNPKNLGESCPKNPGEPSPKDTRESR